MEENKINLEGAKCFLSSIVITLGLILEDMERDCFRSEGIEKAFTVRVDEVYMPALNLIQSSAYDLLQRMEASV